MENDKTRVTVDIYGIQYKLMGKSSSQYMKKVAEHVNDQMHLIAKGHPRLDTPRISVLAAVNMADDFFKVKAELDKIKNDPQAKNRLEAYEKLEEDYERLKKELQQALDQIDAWKEKERRWIEDLRQLQGTYDELKQKHEEGQKSNQQEEQSQHELRLQFDKLKDEYAKLQNEYNEWIQLVEQDPEGS